MFYKFNIFTVYGIVFIVSYYKELFPMNNVSNLFNYGNYCLLSKEHCYNFNVMSYYGKLSSVYYCNYVLLFKFNCSKFYKSNFIYCKSQDYKSNIFNVFGNISQL